MRRYESVWVVNGDLPDEEVKATIDKFSQIITSQGGILVGVDDWGRKKLAYKIRGTLRGYYLAAQFAGEPTLVQELERNYRIDDRVIRYLTIKRAEHVDLEALQAEIAARAAAPPPPPTEVESDVEAAVDTAAGPESPEGGVISPESSVSGESATPTHPQED